MRYTTGNAIIMGPWTKGLNKNGEYVEMPKSTMTKLKDASDSGEIDVLVVGGGFTGVECWSTLNAGNANAWLVEATDSVGGSIESVCIEKNGKKHRFDIGNQFAGRAHRALYTLTNKTYPQFARFDKNKSTNPNGLMDLSDRPNSKGDAVETFNGRRYTYKEPQPTTEEITPHCAPIEGLPPAIPSELNVLRDNVPFTSVSNFMKLIEGLINMTDVFYEAEEDPKKKYKTSIVPYLKKLDQISLETWLLEQGYTAGNVKDLVRLYASTHTAIQPDKISMLSFLQFTKTNGSLSYLMNSRAWGPQQYMLRSSFQTLVNTVAMEDTNKGRVVLNARVVRIDYERKLRYKEEGYVEGAIVTFADGTVIHAKQVVLAMSSIVATKHIELNHLNDNFRGYLKDRTKGERLRLNFLYEKPFWREGRRTYRGYTGQWGKLPQVRNGDCAVVINTMDTSFDDDNLFVISASIQSSELAPLRLPDGTINMQKAKNACLLHFYEAFDRRPGCPEDFEAVEGANLLATFGGVWDNHSLSNPTLTMLKPHGHTNYQQYLYRNQGLTNDDQNLPLFFASSSNASAFPGTITGAITAGCEMGLQMLAYLKGHTASTLNPTPEPYNKLATTDAFYQQFEPTEMDNGSVRSLPMGYLDFTPPQALNYGNVERYTEILNRLDYSSILSTPSIDPYATIGTVNASDFAIAGVPNPGLHKTQFDAMSYLERGNMLIRFSNFGNVTGFFQLCDEDCILEARGPKAYKKYIPYIGTWKGTNPLDPKGIVGFFVGCTCINEIVEYRRTYQDPMDVTRITYVGPSLMVPPGLEANRDGKEGTDWANVETAIELNFNKKTGYIKKITIYSDNMTVYQLLKNNNIIPSDA